MASVWTSLNSFSNTLSRLEEKLESINAQFEELEEAADRLTRQLEQHSQDLALQAHQDQVWLSLLDDRLTAVETNLCFTYTTDALRLCRALTLERLPELAPNLPTVASLLRRKLKNRQINTAWESALKYLGFESSHVIALCAFFVTYGYKAEYYNLAQRQKYSRNEKNLISRVGNEVLRNGLLKAVEVVKKGLDGVSCCSGSRELPNFDPM